MTPRHAACLALLLLLSGALNMTEYRAVVFYANSTQSIYADRLLVNSTSAYGASISYAGRNLFVPGEGSYVFYLPDTPFNLSVAVRNEGSWIGFRIGNNHTFPLNITANISVENASPVCGRNCIAAAAYGDHIIAGFSIPAGDTGALFILPTSTYLRVERAELNFSFTLPALVNETVPLLLEVQKRNVSSTWYATFTAKNPGQRDVVAHLRGWYELNGSDTELFNLTRRIPGNSSWSTTRSVSAATAPVFYFRATAVNTSPGEVGVVPAYPHNLSSPGLGLVYGRALVLANVSLSAAPTAVNITSFTVRPSRVERHSVVEFTIEVVNRGTSDELIEPEIEIYSGGALVDRLTLLPVTLRAGSNITLVRSYIAGMPEGSYRAVAKVYYRNRSAYATATSWLGVYEEEGGIEEIPPVLTRETPRLRFAFLPVLIEGKPGDTSRVSFEVENPTGVEIQNVRLGVEGLPGEWVQLEPRVLSIPGGESVVVDLSVEVPLSALPGDHRVVLRLSGAGEEASTFFIFRIKPYPPRLEKPAVLREVYLDEKVESTRVRVKVENSGIRAERLEIVEEIPKEIASNVAEIRFRSPVTVIEADPVVAWRLRDVEPYEAYTLEYEVNRIAERYSPYIYWPLRQINLFYAAIRGIDLLQFSSATAAYARPGEAAEVTLRVVNPSLEALNLSFRIVAPPGWSVTPQEVSRLLMPGYVQELVFTVRAPEDATPGSYTLTAVVAGAGGELSQPLTLILLEEERRVNLRRVAGIGAGALALLLVAYVALTRYRKREVYRHEVVEAVGRIRERMERE
ncbi:MAG: hypothetical protein GXO66_06510 [Euryarchaeota archaeon]|nr:hypothetical protein [Euryarchaeota archaeon]